MMFENRSPTIVVPCQRCDCRAISSPSTFDSA